MASTLTPEILLRQIYRHVREFAIFTTDGDGVVNSWNVGAEMIFGFAPDEILGHGVECVFTPEDVAEGQPGTEMQSAFETGHAADYRWHMRKDGSRFWADGVLTPIVGDHQELIGYLKILRDITERKLAQDEIRRLASVDMLTGLANRAAFDLRRAELVSLSLRTGQLLLLLLIDLDQFKEVNDLLGHQAGDLLLRQAAQRIRSVSRESDFIARLGGDEFALLQLNVAAAVDGGALAEKLLAALARPFDIEQREVRISASIGIAVCPVDAGAPEVLLKKADLALYHAKNAGRNCFHYYTDELDLAAHRKNADHSELRRVVAQQTFWLDYQPIVDAASGRTVAMEALLRFPGPDLSAYPVDYVIDLAREIGKMPELGALVFHQACLQLRAWHDAGFQHLRICINTCAKELLDPYYVRQLEDALARSRLQAGDIEIELTERDAIELERNGSQVVQGLRRLGFLLSLDDFGTGYSSLSYLRTLPVTTLKLDKSFLLGVPDDADANAVARTVISLAKDLRMNVIAEGVESAAQADFLRALGCNAFQGHLFSPALPLERATAWLHK